jgi:feruloyl-CoA synthase
VVVDWLPWSHTFGGNHNFHMVLRHGGTLFVDAGKPAPGLVERTVWSLRTMSPTVYFNVPRGFDVLLPYLERDADLREALFRDLDVLFYAAAALPQSTWERLERVAELAGKRVPLTSAWGSTETAPLVTSVHFRIERAGNIGVPAPGCELALVPVGDRHELRVRGPGVTPGYFRDEAATAAAFDDEGFFRMGDAGKLADPDDPSKGVVFDGRLSENFKLGTGTWVSVGELRVALVAACAPLVADCVLAGHDGDAVSLLVFPSLAGAADLVGERATLADVAAHPTVRARLAAALAAHNAENPAATRRIARAMILVEPPSIDGGEITDKGYVNQRAVLSRRSALVSRLVGEHPDDDVIVP